MARDPKRFQGDQPSAIARHPSTSRVPRQFVGDDPPVKVTPRGMTCPKCGAERAWVLWVKDATDSANGSGTRIAGRECRVCKHRFQTPEMVKD